MAKHPPIPSEFERGILIAASIVVAQHDEPGIAADMMIDCGVANANVSDFSEYDKENLRETQGHRGIVKLYGLGRKRGIQRDVSYRPLNKAAHKAKEQSNG